MLFRALGNTGLDISAISLGGHWRTHDGRRYYDSFEGDEVPGEVLTNRREVVAACLEAGINYIDVTTAAEALAYGRALGGCRDRFVIGADDYQWSARNRDYCNPPALIANVERCLTRLGTDRLDIWRVTAEVHGRNTDTEMEAVVEAADRLREAGKIRHLGVSSHNPGWIQRAVSRFPEFQIAIVPCTPLTCDNGSAPPEPFRTFGERGLGLMTIKPFAGGLLFSSGDQVENRRLAQFTLRHIIHFMPGLTCVLAGMSNVQEVHAAVEAVNSPPLDADERGWLERIARSRVGTLPAEYAWLGEWQAEKNDAGRR